MIKVNAIGDTCPIPVVKTKEAIKSLNGSGVVETLVDNEIAVQNLTKMANQKGYEVKSEKISNGEFQVTMTILDGQNDVEISENEQCLVVPEQGKKKVVIAISSEYMGDGSEELGKTLMKGFIYALGQQDNLPTSVLFYNGGANIPCEGSVSIEDLKSLEAQGVEILTCGTCLNFYGLSEKLAVGGVTNMYDIVEKLTTADVVVKP